MRLFDHRPLNLGLTWAVVVSVCSCADALTSQSRLLTQSSLHHISSWNLEKALRDEPPGAYRELLDPVVYAAQLTYATTHGTSHWERFKDNVWRGSWSKDFGAGSSTPGLLSGDGNWTRFPEVEQDPPSGGAHIRALVDRQRQRVIIAIRGSCLDTEYSACRSDVCLVDTARLGIDRCVPSLNIRAYVEMAARSVRKARGTLGHEFSIMVTGHSLGGLIALSLAAVGVLDVQVVALEPTPFGNVMRHQLNFSDEQLRSLDVTQRYALYDPYDLLETSFGPLEELRPSTTVCMYMGAQMPAKCKECVKSTMDTVRQLGMSNAVNADSALRACLDGAVPSGEQTEEHPYPNLCKHDSHELDRYVDIYLPSPGANEPHILPYCQAVTVR